MTIEIKLPHLGENVDSADVLSVLVKEGDVVENGQGLIELETDKATMEMPSPEAGKVASIHVSEGDTLSVGALVVTLEPAEKSAESESPKSSGDAEEKTAKKKDRAAEETQADNGAAEKKREPSPKKEPASSEPDQAPAPATAATSLLTPEGDVPGDGKSSAAAGPSVRRLARDLGVDLRDVKGTGRGGRITDEDVREFVRAATARSHASANRRGTPAGESSDAAQEGEAKTVAAAKPEAAADDFGPVRREKMSRIRQTIAKNMLQSYTTIPQLTNFDDVDVTDLENVRRQSKSDYAKRGLKLTMLPFLIKSVAAALRQHPIINASLDTETNEVIYKEYVNIGIAVDTERGLVVPVMRDVDEMSVPQITRSLATMSEKVREGQFGVDELRGGTFTISNLGAIGGAYSTPIINPPEVAILLVGRSRTLPVIEGTKVTGRLIMPLSITYDHRVVDGAAAARFLNDVKAYLSTPGRLLLAP